MEIQIKAGDFDVIQSGSVIYMPETPLIFNCGQLKITIILHSDTETDKNGKNITSRQTADKDLEIHFYIKGLVNLSSKKPVSVGTLDGRILLLTFYWDLFALMTNPISPVVFNYMWLLGDKIK